MRKTIALNRIEYGARDTSGRNVVTVFEEGDEVVGLPDSVLRELMAGKTTAFEGHKDAITAVGAKTTRERAARDAATAADSSFAAAMAELETADKGARKVPA